MSRIPVRRALVSVSDKSGLVDFVSRLHAAGIEIVSSGGTATVLSGAGLPVVTVSSVTGHPEILSGRVKTLHPRIHGGILADPSDDAHAADLVSQGIRPFQLVVSNLYPFSETVADPAVNEAEAVEQIDIGGPAMVRAAAKNHAWVGIVTDPAQYGEVAAAVEAGGLDADLRRRLAREAFFHTASYDAAIVGWLERDEPLPERRVLALRRHSALRYGENPHQAAAAYREVGNPAWWQHAEQRQGKELSFNNVVDADAAWRHVHEFSRPACVIVKHTNACGVAIAATLRDAFAGAWECDPVSAFGSVIALNRPLDVDTSRAMEDAGFIEVVVAPGVEDAGPLERRPNLRLLVAPPPAVGGVELRPADRGFLAQVRDQVGDDGDWKVVTERSPTAAESADLEFAWRVAAHTKSNAIVIARGGRAVGIGAGDQSRVGAARRAAHQADGRAAGAVAASDAFFPFPDGVEELAASGVTAVVQPGGSKGDAEVIAAADRLGLAMVFTGRRHFRH